MSSMKLNRKPFRIELKRQENGNFLMKKTNFVNQLNMENIENDDTNFEYEKDLNIAIEKWSKFYKIRKNALNSLQRILNNIKFKNNNFQISNDGSGGLNINITNDLLQNLINKNENPIKFGEINDSCSSDIEYNSEDPLEFEQEMYSVNNDDYEPPAKYQRRNLDEKNNEDNMEDILQLPCTNLKQISRFEIKLKRNREIRKHFCSLILKEKKITTDLLIFLEQCLGIVFSEYIFTKFSLSGDNGKIKLIDNFIIKVISECTLELFPSTNINEIHTIISNCFDNCEKKKKIALLNSILCDKLVPMLKRNKHKISEETLLKDLQLPCRNSKDFLILNKNCQQKEYCQKLCMILLNQPILIASDFVENCFKKIFSNEIKECNNIQEIIEKSFIIEILKQCTEQCFEDITMDYVISKLKEYFIYISIDLTYKANNITKYEIDIIDYDDYNGKQKDQDEYDMENDEITEKKNFSEYEFRLPCTNDEELKKFDDLCRNNEKFAQNIKNLLLKKDGCNIIKFTAECLSNIFNRALACTYNWTGSNGEKHAVHDLFLVTIILNIGMNKFPDITKRKAELAIMRWFRYAQQRYQYNKYTLCNVTTATVPINIMEYQIKKSNLTEEDEVDSLMLYESELNLPCESQEELKILNRGCETPERSKFKALVAIFFSEKTEDPRRYARKCLERVLSQTLAIEYNWTGRGVRQKIAISNFPIIRVLQNCYKELYPEETLDQLERDCVKFFKYTNQRLSLKSTENVKDLNTVSDTKLILTEIMKT